MTLFGSLEIGKRGMGVAQSGQHTSGHNMSNANTEGYSRQDINQSAFYSHHSGKPMGVTSEGVRRIHDEFTQKNIIDETSISSGWKKKSDLLKQIEIIFAHNDEKSLNHAVGEFWDSWSSLANDPESQPLRKNVIERGETLTNRFRDLQGQLKSMQHKITDETENTLKQINEYAEHVASLNKKIQQIEFRNGNPNDFKDERDRLVEKIAEKIEVKALFDNRGHLNLNVGNGYALVSGFTSNAMERHFGGSAPELGGIGIRMGGQKVFDMTQNLKSGTLKEMIGMRDQFVASKIDNLDHFFNKIIRGVNDIHSGSSPLQSSHRLDRSSYVFSQEERTEVLPNLKTGTLTLNLTNQQNETVEKFSIFVDAGVDSIEDIVRKINEETNAFYEEDGEKTNQLRDDARLKAVIEGDGSISLKAGRGFSFIYGKDETSALGVLGLNSFFEGGFDMTQARIKTALKENEMLLGAGSNLNPGDNRIALEISELRFGLHMNDGTTTFEEYYDNQIIDNGLKLQESLKAQDTHNDMLDQYTTLRDAVSAVNLDEELTNMVKYQKAYEASAKFVTTVDQMTQTLINM